jgi:NTE family protein
MTALPRSVGGQGPPTTARGWTRRSAPAQPAPQAAAGARFVLDGTVEVGEDTDRMRSLGRLGSALLGILVAGCSTFRASNQPLARWDPTQGYRPPVLAEQRPFDDVLLLLAFSGGGTRAAAFSYGVLQELRDTPIASGRLLDEVDTITSVSGGSFTSAYYALHGDGIFEDFERRMLRNDLQGGLIRNLLNPLNWFRLLGGFFDRSELAVALYDRNVFDGATFADLITAKGPLVQINATDLAAGSHFTFFQPQFDFLCSDLSPFSVARAVTASSAVPGAFSPIVLRNYAGSCGFGQPAWLESALADPKSNPRRFRAATILSGYLDPSEWPYVHLVDGGISDNIGLRVPLDNVLLTGGLPARTEQLGARVRHILVIVVNAEAHPKPSFNLAASAPGLLALLGSVSSTQIYSYNFDTIELMRESLARWAKELPPAADGSRVDASLIDLEFDGLADPAEREFLNSVPTALSLPDATIDRLIAAGRQLLRESPEYRALVEALRSGLERRSAEPSRR